MELNLQQELQRTLFQEELTWFQRSKNKWLMEGGRNTHFYHVKFVQRRRRKHVQAIKDAQGKWTHEPIEINNAFKENFYIMYTTI